jgi:hypothetical protein
MRRISGVVEIAVAVHNEQKHVSISQVGARRNPFSAVDAVLVAERQGPGRVLGHDVPLDARCERINSAGRFGS